MAPPPPADLRQPSASDSYLTETEQLRSSWGILGPGSDIPLARTNPRPHAEAAGTGHALFSYACKKKSGLGDFKALSKGLPSHLPTHCFPSSLQLLLACGPLTTSEGGVERWPATQPSVAPVAAPGPGSLSSKSLAHSAPLVSRLRRAVLPCPRSCAQPCPVRGNVGLGQVWLRPLERTCSAAPQTSPPQVCLSVQEPSCCQARAKGAQKRGLFQRWGPEGRASDLGLPGVR